MVYNSHLVLGLLLEVGWLLTINPRLPCIIFYLLLRVSRKCTHLQKCPFSCLGLVAVRGNLTVLSNWSSICLNWTRSFSLDITGVDPDFWYCVEVYNISRGRAPLSTNCSVYEPEFCFTAPNHSPCDLFELRVFAVNQVGNGSVASVNGTFYEGIFPY